MAYADRPVKSDAIVLFVGSDLKARETEALRLLYRGYGKVLLIPAYQEVVSREKVPFRSPGPRDRVLKMLKLYPGFYERTHVEVLYAKKMMDAMGLRSAIMVSAPYHMERIRMMAGRVFGERAAFISYVPTRYEYGPVCLTNMDRHDWRFVISEYIKICWFRLYSPFCQ